MDIATPNAAFEPAVATLTKAVDAKHLAGAVTLVWRKGEIVHTAAVGMADIEQRRPMRRNTLFRIASMTKPVTSVAALMLMEEGAFALSDPITRYAPEFADMKVLKSPTGPVDDVEPARREITFEDLFTHRAGLAYAFTSSGPIAHAHQAALGDVLTSDMTPDAWMAALGGLPLTYQPGERMHYSHATDVLGFLVGRIARTGFREFLRERIFGPLGMIDTDFYIPTDKRERAAVIYGHADAGGLEAFPMPLRDAPPKFCGGGGGLISTADDYLAFARMLIGGGAHGRVRLLKAETVELMTRNRLTDAQRAHDFLGFPMWTAQGFGLGVSMILDPAIYAMVGAGSAGAFGWPGAFGTSWQADPAADLIYVYLIQDHLPLGPEAVTQMTGERAAARLVLPVFQKQIYAAAGVAV